MESQQLIERIEELVRKIEAMADPEARATRVELLQSLMELNGAGLERMLELTAETGAAGEALIEGFARDELVRGLLLLYGLHPVALETRVAQGLESLLNKEDSQLSVVSSPLPVALTQVAKDLD